MVREDTQLAVIANNIEYIKKDIVEIKSNMKSDYVTADEFEPIKRVVYGVVWVMLLALITTMVRFVLK